MHPKDRRSPVPVPLRRLAGRLPHGRLPGLRWRSFPVLLLLAACFGALLVSGTAVAAQAPTAPVAAVEEDPAGLARAREALEAGLPEEGLRLVEDVLAQRKDHPAALLVRSTAHFMLGDLAAGRRDLERSLALDPDQRQGWLNLGALAVSEERYDDALQAFRRAEALDPRAADNDLNIGALLLLKGDLQTASQRFARYLQGPGSTAEGFYLVASNYALAGYEALAVEHLRQAIQTDERTRRRARTDPNFGALQDNPRFQRLIATDLYEPPPGGYARDETFPVRYEAGRGPLLPAVLDALQLGGRPFDPQVEVTDAWALIWGDLRIKVSDTLGDQGRVQLSAAPGAFTPAKWRQVTTDLLQRIQHQALRRSLAMEEQKRREEEKRQREEDGGIRRPLP